MKKILIIQTAFIGDVILATALIEKLGGFYPNLKIDFLLRKGNESLLKGHPRLNEVIIWDKKGGKYVNLYKTLRRVRRNNYDVVVNLQRFLSSGILSAFSGAGRIIGFDKNPLSAFYNERHKHVITTAKDSPHEVSRNLELVKELTNEAFVGPKLYPSINDFADVRCAEEYITISPTSVWFTKQWPAEKWASFMNTVPNTIKVFLLGAPADKAACQKISDQSTHNNIEIKAGAYSLLQSAALMKNARMNYVNDSAPMHLASAMNAPVTAVFLSTVPAFGFTPLSDDYRIVETREALDCRPCGLHGKAACPKGHFKCAEISLVFNERRIG